MIVKNKIRNLSERKSMLLIALFTLISCWLLFYIDHETKNVTDLFKTGNLFALLLYFVPTFIICVLLYNWFFKKFDAKNSLFWSLVIGIPISFTIVLFVLYQLMHR